MFSLAEVDDIALDGVEELGEFLSVMTLIIRPRMKRPNRTLRTFLISRDLC
jgi:hypothetical protein